MEYYLGIDMGTSSIKANVIDENGLIVSKARTSVSLRKRLRSILRDILKHILV